MISVNKIINPCSCHKNFLYINMKIMCTFKVINCNHISRYFQKPNKINKCISGIGRFSTDTPKKSRCHRYGYIGTSLPWHSSQYYKKSRASPLCLSVQLYQ